MTTQKEKPPAQVAGVQGFNAFATKHMPQVDWAKLTSLPPFEMFVLEQSGLNVGSAANDWVKQRRSALGDSVLYEQYAAWHKNKGLWANETPLGKVKD